MKVSIFEIYKVFFITGLQLLGGGYVIVPLLKKYIVEKRNWMSEEELVNFYAMSQCIPGIIAGNIATCAGYRTRGILGALAAISGIVTPSFLIIILLANILSGIIDYPIVQSAFWGIRISVVILIVLTIKDLWRKSVNSPFTCSLFAIILLCFFILPLSPALIIILSAITALLYSKIRRNKNV